MQYRRKVDGHCGAFSPVLELRQTCFQTLLFELLARSKVADGRGEGRIEGTGNRGGVFNHTKRVGCGVQGALHTGTETCIAFEAFHR